MGKAKKHAQVAKLPKRECCVAKTRCNRCPLRMLKEGTLPPGYTVHRRKLVRIEHLELHAKKGARPVVKVKKADLKKAVAKAARANTVQKVKGAKKAKKAA